MIIITVVYAKTGWKLAPMYYVRSIIEMRVIKEHREAEQTGDPRQPTGERPPRWRGYYSKTTRSKQLADDFVASMSIPQKSSAARSELIQVTFWIGEPRDRPICWSTVPTLREAVGRQSQNCSPRRGRVATPDPVGYRNEVLNPLSILLYSLSRRVSQEYELFVFLP